LSGAPDFHKFMYIAKQGVYLELIHHWQARVGEYFTIVVDSGTIAAGASVTTDTTVPSGETWYVHHAWGQSCVTVDLTRTFAEIIMLNATDSLYFFFMTVSRVGFHPAPLLVPMACDAGDVIRVIQQNASAATDNRYYAGFAGYKIGSAKPRPWEKIRDFRRYLDQAGINGIFYDHSKTPMQIVVYNGRLRELCTFEVRRFQQPDEKAEMIKLIKQKEVSSCSRS